MYLVLVSVSLPMYHSAAFAASTKKRGERAAVGISNGTPAGIYPLWEGNGMVLKHQKMILGPGNAQFGIDNIAHVGTDPSDWLFSSPNGHAKWLLKRSKNFSVAARVGVTILLPGASDDFNSKNYRSRLNNTDETVLTVPLSLGSTWRVNRWFHLHNNFTAIFVAGDKNITTEITLGDALVFEFLANRYNSMFFSIAEVGFSKIKHDLYFTGIAYRFRYDWFESSIGYYYRTSSAGTQTQPLFSINLIL